MKWEAARRGARKAEVGGGEKGEVRVETWRGEGKGAGSERKSRRTVRCTRAVSVYRVGEVKSVLQAGAAEQDGWILQQCVSDPFTTVPLVVSPMHCQQQFLQKIHFSL